ncbi:hypothetical protein SASPL_100972 [Salvia splendens]|uniref:Uncharacterized protein n=1 Tax=Salvia splendens TaxID=180675 RepID=A0A8X8YQV7_SALSN|nr:hypothetical protein SASPL_100972 [Salvia splendens]
MLLVCLLLILIITSQFEWRQQLVRDMDTNPAESQKQQPISKREEGVKEKHGEVRATAFTDQVPFLVYANVDRVGLMLVLQIILSQEKSIQKLNEVVKSLREQLQQCHSINETTTLNATLSSLAESIIELERQQILED